MRLKAPEGRDTRPVLDRVKQSWFDILGTRLADAKALDLFCGVGSLGLEALSRGARSCVFVEQSSACVDLLREHLAKTRFDDQATVKATAVEIALEGLASRGERFDCVFLDPPFAMAMEPGFYAEGSLLDAAGSVTAADGLLMLRREVPRSALDELPPGLAECDRRRWGRNQVLFLQHPGSD